MPVAVLDRPISLIRLPIVLFKGTIGNHSADQRLGRLIGLYFKARAQTASHSLGGSHYFADREPNFFIFTKTVATPSHFVFVLSALNYRASVLATLVRTGLVHPAEVGECYG